jgi:4-hydroxy-2-oxoheptanedioate aldolase
MSVIDTRFNELVRKRDDVAGIMIGIPHPALVEMSAYAGFDFVIIDNEHGVGGMETTEHMVRAAKGAGTIALVRTQFPDILRCLDLGASGVLVPGVETAAQAAAVVGAAKYPPLGNRGAAFSPRAAGYGFFGGIEHVARSNEGTAAMVMIESVEALKNLPAILATPGLDAAFIGPNDLSFSMGLPGQMTHPDVRGAILDALKLIAASPVAPGVLANSAEITRSTARPVPAFSPRWSRSPSATACAVCARH